MQEAYITAPPSFYGNSYSPGFGSSFSINCASLSQEFRNNFSFSLSCRGSVFSCRSHSLCCRPLLVLCVTGVCFAAIRCRCHPCRCCFGCWGWLRWFYNLSLSLLDSLLLKLSSLGLAFLAAGPSVVSFWTGGAFLFMVSGHTFLFPKLLGRLGRQDGLRCS